MGLLTDLLGDGNATTRTVATAVFLGNSWSDRADNANGDFVDTGWPVWFQALSGQALNVVKFAGVSGEQYTQFLSRVATDVTPYAPGWVFIDGPTNDISNGADLAMLQSRLLALLDALAPARVVTYTCPPNTTFTSGPNAIKDAYNDWLRRLPNSTDPTVTRTQLVVAEVHDVLVTPGAKTFLSTLTADGTHPNPDGALKTGAAVYAACAPFLPAAHNGRLSGGSDSLNILGANADFIGGPLATGWTNSDAVNLTPSIVASDDGITANWQRATVTSSGTAAQLYSRPTGWAVGDTFYGAVECRVQSLGAASGNAPHNYLRLTCLGAAGTPSIYALSNVGPAPRSRVPSGVLTLKTGPITIPAGTTNLQIGLISFGEQVVDWRRPRLAKVGTPIS